MPSNPPKTPFLTKYCCFPLEIGARATAYLSVLCGFYVTLSGTIYLLIILAKRPGGTYIPYYSVPHLVDDYVYYIINFLNYACGVAYLVSGLFLRDGIRKGKLDYIRRWIRINTVLVVLSAAAIITVVIIVHEKWNILYISIPLWSLSVISCVNVIVVDSYLKELVLLSADEADETEMASTSRDDNSDHSDRINLTQGYSQGQ